MTTKPRFVLDTNLVVSAVLIKQSISRRAFNKAGQEGQLLLSMAVIVELNDVLKREKFNKYLTESERLGFLNILVHEAELIQISEPISECRDPKDDKFLELAVNGQADAIISGDQDLLVLNPFREISIVDPHQFLQMNWSLAQ
jgi:putative PIN family toxin of toxin-antitoxin system